MNLLRLYGLVAGLLIGSRVTWATGVPNEPPGIDSLRTRLAALPADTSRVLVLDELCWQLSNSDLRQAIAYGERGLALARRLHYRRGQLKCLNDLGNCAMYGADFLGGTQYFQAALKLAQQPPVDAQIIGFAYNGLASLHLMQKEYPEAQRYLEQGLAQARQRHSAADVALFTGNLGNVLRLRGQTKPAHTRLQRALFLYDSLGNQLGQTSCLTNLAQLANDQRHWALARRYAQQSSQLAAASNNTYYLGVNYALLGGIELALGHFTAAQAASQRGLAYARQSSNDEVIADCYSDLAATSQQQGDFRQAYVWQKHFIAVHDSLVNTAKSEEIAALRVRFDSEQKELRIRALTQQNQVQALQASQQRGRLQALVLLLVAGALATAGGLAYLSQRRRLARVMREERLRSRIAADLHDEVGTLLARVSMQADVLRQNQPVESPALDRLLANARAAAGTMRDIVWGIDAHADTAGALLDRMREHVDQSAAAAGLNTHLTVTGLTDEQPLASELRQHLFLIFKEAVTNAVRHAHAAPDLWVTLACAAGELRLLVRDNGRPTPAACKSSGLGLRSMRQRAQALHGTLVAGPDADGSGFTVALTVPLKPGAGIVPVAPASS
ncbi:tetratricopeptide repeat protein [Hymenobacter negativus]|uniref:Tetratricopeptide repeat protein n=1 Tax=Hymenobacter negativus TaxID=2795026 RepID=A0ABS3QMJ3_9BACT|nr:tetratricopeptide repeat protein [Hymenobacter negativus]MBO2012481.1 tetratricopeptide repeat protein [Hymenobacter negativus]